MTITPNSTQPLHLNQVIGQQVLPKYLPLWFDAYLSYDRQPEFLRIVEDSTLNRKYKSSVLKYFIRLVESDNKNELHEDLFEGYASYMLPHSDSSRNIVNYSISNSIRVRLYEEPNVISRDGCTGHRTWEAAIALADYLVDTPSSSPISYVELGAGTGLAGLVASQLPQTQQVILTDGDITVVNSLEENIRLNNEYLRCPVHCQPLWWGRDSPVSLGPNTVILAADVTYDMYFFPSLVSCIKEHLLLAAIDYALVSATIRSHDTFMVFQNECKTKGLDIEFLKTYFSPFASRHFFISPESPDIVILRLSCSDPKS